MAKPKEQPVSRSLRIGGVAFDLKLTVSVLLTLLVLMVLLYRWGPFSLLTELPEIEGMAYDQFVLFFLVPVFVVLAGFRENPAHYGLTPGRWKEGLLWTGVICAVIAAGLLLMMNNADIAAWYEKRNEASVWKTILVSGAEMWGWEFLLRGFLLFAVARVTGPGPAILVQTIPFAMLHIGKVPLEAFSTLFSGIGFGFIAWRTRSFLYPFLIHWFMLCFIVLMARSG
jgi:uncharacterized protein